MNCNRYNLPNVIITPPKTDSESDIIKANLIRDLLNSKFKLEIGHATLLNRQEIDFAIVEMCTE